MVTSTVIQRQEVSSMKKLKLLSIPNSKIVDENIKVIIEGRGRSVSFGGPGGMGVSEMALIFNL